MDCENNTVVIFSLEGGKAKTIEHKFKEPTGIAFLPVLDVVAVCDSSDCRLVLFAKNRDGVLVVNCPKEISPIHVSSFQGVGSAIFLASSTSKLYKLKVTLNSSKDGRNSSAVLVEVAGHRPHPTHSNEDGPAASSKLSCVSSLWSVGSACFIAEGGRRRPYTPTQEFQNWMETLRKGHEAYGLTEKRLGEIYKCKVRAMDYPLKIKALEQRSSYFGRRQMKLPKGYRERKKRKPWRIQGYHQKGREA